MGDDPFPWVSGSDWFTSTTLSPAWKLVGYGAIVGWQSRVCYGVIVVNQQPKTNIAAHAVVVDPTASTIHEAFRRAGDGRWLSRKYTGMTEGSARKTGAMGPDSILDDCNRGLYEEIRGSTISPLVELLVARRELASDVVSTHV
jgi:hypothetical protein